MAALPAALRADEAEDLFNSLYAGKVKQAQGTVDFKDDLALAQSLLEAAGSAAEQPKLAAILCKAAHDLSFKREAGWEIAAGAMQKLIEASPGNTAARTDGYDKLVDVRQKQYAAAKTAAAKTATGQALLADLLAAAQHEAEAKDEAGAAALNRQALVLARTVDPARAKELQAELDDQQRRQRLQQRVLALQTALLENATDHAKAEELVRLLIIDLNEPAKALAYLDRAKDAELKKCAVLAGKPLGDLTADEANALGAWFFDATGKLADAESKATAYARSKECLERFLVLHATKDLARTKAELLLKQIPEGVLTANPLRPATTAGARLPANLLDLVDLEKDVVSGKWERNKAGSLRCSSAPKVRVAFPVVIDGDYRFSATFTIRKGDDANICLLFPVNGKTLLATLESRGKFNGFDTLEGKGRWDHPHAKAGKFITAGRKYIIEVEVKQSNETASLVLFVDGKRVTQWTGRASSVVAPENGLLSDARNVGLGIWDGEVEFHAASLKMLTGEAKLLRESSTPDPKNPSTETKGVIDILKAVDLDKSVNTGTWTKAEGGGFKSPRIGSFAKLMVPVAPTGDYTLTVKLTRREGDNAIGIGFPIGKQLAHLVMDGQGDYAGVGGIDVVDGGQRHRNVTSGPARIKLNEQHTVEITVKPRGEEVAITTTFDGKLVSDWKGKASRITTGDGLGVGDERVFVMHVWDGVVEFHSATLKMLSGKAEVVRDLKH